MGRNICYANKRSTWDQGYLPSVSGQWQYIEGKIREICNLFSYKEIRTPIFRTHRVVFAGNCDTTDIVEKEMYTFTDRGERSLTLRDRKIQCSSC